MSDPRPRRRRPEAVLLLAGILLGLAACNKAPGPASQDTPAQPAVPGTKQISRTLYYPEGESLLLAACTVTLPAGAGVQQDMEAVVRRYLEGPPCGGQFQPFAEHSGLRAVYLLGSQAVVDLTGPVRSGGGSSTEVTRVYGLVQSLCANFPEVKSVRIVVDGQEVDSLLGHLDLSRPLVPEARLLSRPGQPQSGGTP